MYFAVYAPGRDSVGHVDVWLRADVAAVVLALLGYLDPHGLAPSSGHVDSRDFYKRVQAVSPAEAEALSVALGQETEIHRVLVSLLEVATSGICQRRDLIWG